MTNRFAEEPSGADRPPAQDISLLPYHKNAAPAGTDHDSSDVANIALWDKINTRLFDLRNPPPAAPTVFALNGVPICSGGNLTGIYGPPKGAKSSFLGCLIAAAMAKRGQKVDTLGVSGPNDRGLAFIHVDTELSRQDHHERLSLAVRRVGLDVEPDWLYSLNATGFRPVELMSALCLLVKKAAALHGGIFAITLDGQADFLSSVNNEEEANALVAALHKMAIEHNCPIIGVIHFNPGTNRARGHIGSQWIRKAETNLVMMRKGDVTTVYGTENRKHGISKPNGVSFRWDEALQMHSIIEPVQEITKPAEENDVDEEEPLDDLIEQIFEDAVPLQCQDVIARIIDKRGGSKSTAERRIRAAVEAGLLHHVKGGPYELVPKT